MSRPADETRVATDDIDEAQHVLEQAYSKVRLAVVGSRHSLRMHRLPFGTAELQRITLQMRFTADFAPIGRVGFGRNLAGRLTHQVGSQALAERSGDVFLVGPPDQGITARVHDHDGEYAWFSPATFAEIADTGPVRFLGYRPVSARAAETWSRTYDWVRDDLLGEPATNDLLTGTAARMLAAVSLYTFPNTAVGEPTSTDRHDAHPPTVRRAVTFIEQNAGRDLTPAEIAAACGVTIRTVQLGFRRHLNTTPTAYLRRVRLDHAHRDLRAADPATTTVAEVARRWGFASHSSFTELYRLTFGRLPSTTLRGDG